MTSIPFATSCQSVSYWWMDNHSVHWKHVSSGTAPCTTVASAPSTVYGRQSGSTDVYHGDEYMNKWIHILNADIFKHTSNNSELDCHASHRPRATQESPKRREWFRAGTQSISFHPERSCVIINSGGGLAIVWPRRLVTALEIQSQDSDKIFFFISLKNDRSAVWCFS